MNYPPQNNPLESYIKVTPNDEANLRSKFTNYACKSYPIYVPKGTYSLTDILTIPDNDNARTIIMRGAGIDETVIQEGASIAELLLSLQDSWKNSRLVLSDMTFLGLGTVGLNYLALLPYIKIHMERVKFSGKLHAASANKYMLKAGSSGSQGNPSSYNDVSFNSIGTVNDIDTMFDSWEEDAEYSNIALVASSGDFGANGMQLHGTSHNIGILNCFVGNGKDAHTWLHLDGAQATLGNMYFNNTGVPASNGTLLSADATSTLSIGQITNEALATTYADDATRRVVRRLDLGGLQTCHGGTSGNLGVVQEYFTHMGMVGAGAGHAARKYIVRKPFIAFNARAVLQAAPGAGTTRIIALQKNAADTAITMTFGAADVDKADTTHEVLFAAGDFIGWGSTVTGAPALGNINTVLEVNYI